MRTKRQILEDRRAARKRSTEARIRIMEWMRRELSPPDRKFFVLSAFRDGDLVYQVNPNGWPNRYRQGGRLMAFGDAPATHQNAAQSVEAQRFSENRDAPRRTATQDGDAPRRRPGPKPGQHSRIQKLVRAAVRAVPGRSSKELAADLTLRHDSVCKALEALTERKEVDRAKRRGPGIRRAYWIYNPPAADHDDSPRPARWAFTPAGL